jgi:hypothetical protein
MNDHLLHVERELALDRKVLPNDLSMALLRTLCLQSTPATSSATATPPHALWLGKVGSYCAVCADYEEGERERGCTATPGPSNFV